MLDSGSLRCRSEVLLEQGPGFERGDVPVVGVPAEPAAVVLDLDVAEDVGAGALAGLPEEGRVTALTSLTGRTIRPFGSTGHTLVLLGAKTDSEGLHVSLARGQPSPVVISTSPDGSPGSWTETGTIPAGTSTSSFPLPEVPGAAVRATRTRPDGTTVESAVVFVYSPVHCARRHGADNGPRRRYDYTAQTLFADELAARRFEADLLRLRELTAGTSAPRVSPAPGTTAAVSVTSSSVDRWDAYLADCRRMIGAPLTDLAFGTLQIDLPQAPSSRWIVSAVTGGGRAEDDEPYADETQDADPLITNQPLAPYIAPEQRSRCRTWAQRWVGTLAASETSPAAPVPVRLLVTNLYVQLLAAGAWDENDQSWRDGLGRLLKALGSEAGPNEVEQQAPAETRRPRMTTPPISSPPFRPYGPATSWDTHACPPRDSCSTDRSTHSPKQGVSGSSPTRSPQERRTRGTAEGPRLPPRGRHPRRPVAGPARPLHPGPHRHRVRPAQARHRIHLAARGARHHHARWAPCLPRFAALAEFIRELIVQGTNEGLDAARARGARLGRPPAMTDEQVRHARDLLARPENTVTSIAKLLGVSRNTIYNYVPELKGGRLALAESTNTAELPQPSGAED